MGHQHSRSQQLTECAAEFPYDARSSIGQAGLLELQEQSHRVWAWGGVGGNKNSSIGSKGNATELVHWYERGTVQHCTALRRAA
jgi:hypothetical protein